MPGLPIATDAVCGPIPKGNVPMSVVSEALSGLSTSATTPAAAAK
jgi:hypothetical protein